jgi:hypothetical protein
LHLETGRTEVSFRERWQSFPDTYRPYKDIETLLGNCVTDKIVENLGRSRKRGSD